jgi:hypothetical protein
VYYSDKIDFYAFDVRVHQLGEGGEEKQYWLDYKLAMELFKECGFFYAEPLLVGTLEEVILSFYSLFSSSPSLSPREREEKKVGRKGRRRR